MTKGKNTVTTNTVITLDMLNTMDGQKFENLTATLFKNMGFEVQTTSVTGDGGIDIKAVNNQLIVGGLYIIQCKRYAKKTIGIEEVQRLHGVANSENAIKGIFVTTSRYTKAAKEFCESNNIELIDGKNFVKLLAEYLQETEQGVLRQKLTEKVKYPGESGSDIIGEIKSEIVFKKEVSDPRELIDFINEIDSATKDVIDEMQGKMCSTTIVH